MTDTAFRQIQSLLEDLDFPADKEAIVEHATGKGADRGSDAVRALRAMPLGTYRNMSEVRSSVDLDPSQTPD
jgi:hypothetical protein